MKATKGRIVHYYLPKNRSLVPDHEGEMPFQPAIVTDVDPKDPNGLVVSLTVFGKTSETYASGIEHSEEPKAGFWSWPPK